MACLLDHLTDPHILMELAFFSLGADNLYTFFLSLLPYRLYIMLNWMKVCTLKSPVDTNIMLYYYFFFIYHLLVRQVQVSIR